MSDISCEVVLGQILKLDEERVRNALSLTKDYKVAKVPKKRGGGYRLLYIPPPLLKQVQKKILRRLFRRLWKEWWLNLWLYGIQRKTSYVEHVSRHKDAKWVFQFDLKDAFPSVDVSSLREIIFRRLEDEMVSFEISLSVYRDVLKQKGITDEEVDRLGRGDTFFDEFKYLKKEKREVTSSVFFPLQDMMVKEREDQWFTHWAFPERKEIAQELTDLAIELTTFRGILPQGTPTASFLFYLALTEGNLFSKLRELCPVFDPASQDRYEFCISAYIDNFVISSQKPIPPKNQEELLKTIEAFGLKVNPRKTRHQGTIYGAPLITGLRIIKDGNGEGKVVLPKKKVRQIRGLIHRAIFEPQLRPKVEGLIASLQPIYGARPIIWDEENPEWIEDYFKKHLYFPSQPILSPQLEKPFRRLLQQIELEEEEKKVWVRIVGTPEGVGIPEGIRKGWIGVEFKASGPVFTTLRLAVGPSERQEEKRLVYVVPSEVALRALKEKNIESWGWFAAQERIAPIFCFNAEACKEV